MVEDLKTKLRRWTLLTRNRLLLIFYRWALLNLKSYRKQGPMWALLKDLNNCGCCCCCCFHCCLCLDLRWPQVPWATGPAQRERFQRLSAEEKLSVPVALWVRQRT